MIGTKRKVVCFAILVVCGMLSRITEAGLWGPAISNPSFEDPVLAAGAQSNDINDWWDATAYTYTADEAAAGYPLTPYGDNWSELGNGRWIYQQIGTYDENLDLDISFLAGQRDSKEFTTVWVSLLVGGNPALAADHDSKWTDPVTTNHLVNTVGATHIVTSAAISPFPTSDVGTSMQTLQLSTGTGHSVGDPLWLVIYKESSNGRALIDNVVVTLATNNPVAVNPTPNIGAQHVDPNTSLSWDVQNATDPNFVINIGTDSNCNDVLVGHSTGSTQSYTPSAGLLNYATDYFWCVDVTDGDTEYVGTSVWYFTTGGKATDPVPDNGSTAERSVGALSWSGDALITSYDVHFGNPGNLQAVGNYLTTSVSFGDLATAMGQSVLSAGDYQWRVDTRDSSGTLMVTGDIWNVTIPDVEPIVLEDFDGYNDISEMLVNWTKVSEPNLVLDDLYGSMQFKYDNQLTPWKSEAVYTFGAPQDWTATGMDTFTLFFIGQETNDPEPMYLILSDGTVTATVLYPQADVTTDAWWGSWYIRLSDFSAQGLNLGNVTTITIGIGDGGGSGGTGTMFIDDLSLILPGCIPAFQPPGDLNLDCVANLFDLALLANDWLMGDYAVSAVAPNAGQLLAHYRFNESPGSAIAVDSSTNGHTATVAADDLMVIWDGFGYSGGCINLDSSTIVTLPAAVFSSLTDEVTISLWINGDPNDYPIDVNQVSLAAGQVSQDPNYWDNTAWPIDAADSYGGLWNHYAVIKNASTGIMRIYHNGVIVSQTTDATTSMDGSLAQASKLSLAGFDAGTNPIVKVDDLQIYGYALSHGEIVHLSTGGSGSVTQPIEPIFTSYDVNNDGIINLGDFGILAGIWLEIN